jgi:hypothetical protein
MEEVRKGKPVKFQTVIPAKLNKKRSGSVLIPAKLLKIMVKVMEVNKGCIKYKAVLKPFVCNRHISLHEKHQQITVLPDFLEFSERIFLVLSQTHSVVLFSCFIYWELCF